MSQLMNLMNLMKLKRGVEGTFEKNHANFLKCGYIAMFFASQRFICFINSALGLFLAVAGVFTSLFYEPYECLCSEGNLSDFLKNSPVLYGGLCSGYVVKFIFTT